jgi:Asp-tRNA(Asn)/Glu-tRNA(Gln) amidotransferase A subunit family amidase
MTEVSPATALHELTATQAARLIAARQVSPIELIDNLLARAERVEPLVSAWETLDGERARAAARVAEQQVIDGSTELGPLHGVPFGAKDIYDSAGLRTAAGFWPFDQRVPTVDCEPIARLKRAGAILLGKMVTTQFAYADPPRTRNPWLAERTPGGSSSGSAAGVASREVPLALGSQTAGSILRPAAYNGVVGLKPTYGRISKRGVLPLAWSLDHVGVLVRGVDDCAAFLGAVAGYDPADPTCAVAAVPSFDGEAEPPPPRLGLVRDALHASAPRMAQHVAAVAESFERAGARVVEVTLGEPLDLILAVHAVIMQSEAAAAHWQLLEQFPGAHAPRMRAYVEVGRLLPSAMYLHAQRLRRRIRAGLARSLATVDALLLPTAIDVAPDRATTGVMSLQAPASLAGVPSLSLPSGLLDEPERLPLAIQLVAAAWEEPRLLGVGRWCEAHLPTLPAPPLPA